MKIKSALSHISFGILKSILIPFYAIGNDSRDETNTLIGLTGNFKSESDDKRRNTPSPFHGRIIKKGKTFILEVPITHKKILGTIYSDSTISTAEENYRWIDSKGRIYKSRRKNSNCCSQYGNIVGEIISKDVYLNNIKVGHFKEERQ